MRGGYGGPTEKPATRAARIAPSVRPWVRMPRTAMVARGPHAGGPGEPSGLLARVGEQREFPRAFDGDRQHPLVLGAVTRHSTRQDLAAVGHEPSDAQRVLVVDVLHLLDAKRTVLAFGPAAAPLLLGCSLTHALPPLGLERNVLLRFLGEVVVLRDPSGHARGLLVEASNAVGNHLGHAALLTVLRFVGTDLQPAFHGDQPALAQVLAGLLGKLLPGHDVDEIGVALTLLVGKRPVHRQGGRG